MGQWLYIKPKQRDIEHNKHHNQDKHKTYNNQQNMHNKMQRLKNQHNIQ